MYWLITRCLQVCVCCASLVGIAQDSTRTLEEVEIVGIDLSRFSSGSVIQSIKGGGSGSLSDLGNKSTIYFKNYGNQQLSTISLRGTSSSQTNVIWNGIPVNSPTLGQTDFSVWPMFLTDQIIIQNGGGSSHFGSGAIGGTIILDNSILQKDSLISVYLGYGSFGQREAGLKFHVPKGRFTNEIRLFGSLLDNDFKLEDGSRQKHASVERIGISHKLHYLYKKGRLFSEVAYARNDRDIQPTRTSVSRSTLESQTWRAAINNEVNGKFSHRSTLGLISDQTTFNDSSTTTSYRVVATHAIEKPIESNYFLRFGGTGIYEWAESENFNGIENRPQAHLFMSATGFSEPGSITLNIRQAIYESEAVFIPSIGAETRPFLEDGLQIILRGQLSRDFRAPTFNDLFWIPGGNPDLESERSWNYEFGVDSKLKIVNLSMTAFISDITNWIQWVPTDGVWSPENIRDVQTKGIEVNANSNISIGQNQLLLQGEYTFVESSDQGLDEDNQLPYVPKHSATLSANFINNKYVIELIGNYTGRRFTTLSNSRASRIDDFFLTDLRVSRKFSITDIPFVAAIHIQNLADVNYENLKNTAMPGRAFRFELTTKL